MCRYALHTYKSHFACFACRKAFKKTQLEDYIEHKGLRSAYEAINKLGRTGPMAEEAEKRVGITYQEILRRYLTDVSTCPQCGGQMAAMGLDFKAPPQRNATPKAGRLLPAFMKMVLPSVDAAAVARATRRRPNWVICRPGLSNTSASPRERDFLRQSRPNRAAPSVVWRPQNARFQPNSAMIGHALPLKQLNNK